MKVRMDIAPETPLETEYFTKHNGAARINVYVNKVFNLQELVNDICLCGADFIND